MQLTRSPSSVCRCRHTTSLLYERQINVTKFTGNMQWNIKFVAAFCQVVRPYNLSVGLLPKSDFCALYAAEISSFTKRYVTETFLIVRL